MMIIEIKINDDEADRGMIAYLHNAMRHVADDWEINECLHTNPYKIDEDTLT